MLAFAEHSSLLPQCRNALPRTKCAKKIIFATPFCSTKPRAYVKWSDWNRTSWLYCRSGGGLRPKSARDSAGGSWIRYYCRWFAKVLLRKYLDDEAMQTRSCYTLTKWAATDIWEVHALASICQYAFASVVDILIIAAIHSRVGASQNDENIKQFKDAKSAGSTLFMGNYSTKDDFIPWLHQWKRNAYMDLNH